SSGPAPKLYMATDLFRDFKQNERAAHQRYGRRVIRVSGTVNQSVRLCILEPGVKCFGLTERELVALRNGCEVVIQGRLDKIEKGETPDLILIPSLHFIEAIHLVDCHV